MGCFSWRREIGAASRSSAASLCALCPEIHCPIHVMAKGRIRSNRLTHQSLFSEISIKDALSQVMNYQMNL